MQPMLFADLPLCLPYLPGPRDPRTVGSKLTEQHLGTDYRDGLLSSEAGRTLQAEGWQRLGAGCYSVAYLSPDGERVVKMGCGGGQLATLKAAQTHTDNPHLPKVFGLVDNGYEFIVETEPLVHFDDYDPEDPDFVPDFEDWSATYNPKFIDLDEMPDGPMKDALAALHAEFDETDDFWDCHDGNVMVRPSTGELVLNDLIA